MKHKLLSILLCFAMALSLLPTAALADGETTGAGPIKVGENTYSSFSEAVNAAEPDGGVITYEISGKVEVTDTGWVQVAKAGLNGLSKVEFIGTTEDAEICIKDPTSVLADEKYDIDVSFEDLKLSHPDGTYVDDLGHATNYFTCVLRNTNAANNTVTYTNCTFPDGVCNNQYGKTVFDDCKFTNATSGKYNLWNYGGNTEVKNSEFTGTRGIKAYSEGTDGGDITVADTTFTDLTEKAAIVASKPVDIVVEDISVSGDKGFITRDITGKDEVELNVSGTGISGNFNITSSTNAEAAKSEFNITAGTFNEALDPDYLAPGATINEGGTVEMNPVAKVGTTEYNTLEAAFAALNSNNYKLELLGEESVQKAVWPENTPVYWKAGDQSDYAATLTDALTAAYMAGPSDKITIVCRPGADVGTMTHGHVADNLTIYGNNAYLSGGECDLEVDTYMYSRSTGAQANDGAYLDKNITITAYEMDNLGVWGQRNTAHKVTVNLTDCDGKAIEGKDNPQRVYISGTSGVNDITLTDCDFITAATAVYSNADGEITIQGCSFTGGQAPVNFNHKANGEQTVTVKNSKFENCGDDDKWKQFAAPIRFVNSGSGTMSANVDDCTITGTVGNNGDILIGDGRTNETSNDVALTVSGTAANVQAQKPGYYNGESTNDTKKGSKNVAASDTFTSSIEEMISKGMADYVTVDGIKDFKDKKFASFTDAYKAIKPELEKLCDKDALGEGAATAEKFDELFTDRDANGNATLTYTIVGNVTYDETNMSNLLTMGRKASHYGNDRHLINFKFVGGSNDKTKDTLTVNSNITLPYEWWGEKTTTSISFENLTITGSAPNGLYTYQHFFEGIDFKVDNCTLRGIKIYNCANVGGSYTITDSTLDGTGAAKDAYAIHLQGNETAPLTINISGNTISGYDRGINIDQKTANATISRNKISVNDTNRSCIQLTQLATTTVSGNTLNLTGGNALTFHSQLAESSKINFTGNTVNGNGYLIYDDTKNPIELTYSSNTVASTVDTTKGIYNGITKELTKDVDAVINPAPDYPGGGSSDPTYSVSTPSKTENGTVTVSPKSASKGDTVTITVEPDEGYVLDELTVTDSQGEKVELTKVSDTKYTFTMPRSRVTIEATFVEDPDYVEPGPSTSVADIFDDIQPGAWYEDAVQFAYDEGIMTGTSKTTFEPNTTTTRGMIVSILHRLEGNPVVTEEAFSDVSADDWYGKAVAWASSEGIVGGYGDGTFQPNKAITREEMASILYRYAQYKDQDVSARVDLTKYTDADQVGAWAEEVMQWANAEGLINGMTEDTLVPQGNATRAQVAAMFQRYLNK